MRSVRKKLAKDPVTKKRPINLKYPVDRLLLLDRAVKLHPNSDRTSYIIEAVTKAVEHDLLDRRDFFLSEKDFNAFEEILNAPPQDLKKLKTLLKEKAPWEK